MPFARPTLTSLITQVRQNIVASLKGSDALLRFANLKVLGTVQAGLSHQHYGYLDYIALQSTPYTSTGEYLAAWGALKNVILKAATQAQGNVTFPCNSTGNIPLGTPLQRSDGTPYSVFSIVAQTSTSITVSALANADTTGLTGAFGNCDSGTQFTLGQSIAGVTSTGVSGLIVGGADLETQDDYRSRVILAYQQVAQGGAQADYVEWALEVPGVTRAWCIPLINGAGTVGIYFMMDESESAFQGIPQGSNGVATLETRSTAATGDQLTVANYIFPVRPVTAEVFSNAPSLAPLNMTVKGVSIANRPMVQVALAAQILATATPGTTATTGGTTEINSLWAALESVDPGDDYSIVSPTADVVTSVGSLSVLGTITWE